jgi:ADP-ribosyl-[dinitrogen reductase] hydrolase
MERHELERYKVADIGDRVAALGMDWYSLPIRDVDIPNSEFEKTWVYSGHRLRAILSKGDRILIHCRGGLGRTGTIAARLLVELGWTPTDAISAVRTARPGSIETPSQMQHVLHSKLCDPQEEYVERVLGCLFGGAVGDVLGYEVEFDKLSTIRTKFGHSGIREPVPHGGNFVVSDDTQMTLFTAEGLLRAVQSDGALDVVRIAEEIRAAYLDWLLTQGSTWGAWKPRGTLHRSGPLRHRRAPGMTCLSALEAGGKGTIDFLINDSKGCGGVMRTAPIGLIRYWDAKTTFDVGASASAITHGHPSGFLSGGAMAMMVRVLLNGDDLSEAARQAVEMLQHQEGSEETAQAITLALQLAEAATVDHDRSIRALGQGWVGEEALAIGLYAALAGRTFSEVIAIAANHDGDSDSTASVAGQLHGVWKGVSNVPHEWVRRLDVIDSCLDIIGGLLRLDSRRNLYLGSETATPTGPS